MSNDDSHQSCDPDSNPKNPKCDPLKGTKTKRRIGRKVILSTFGALCLMAAFRIHTWPSIPFAFIGITCAAIALRMELQNKGYKHPYPRNWALTLTAFAAVLWLVVFLAQQADDSKLHRAQQTPQLENANQRYAGLLSTSNSEQPVLSIEIGKSETVFAGPTNGFDFSRLLLPDRIGIENPFRVSLQNGKLMVTARLLDFDGKSLIEIINNEWKVQPPPGTWDRNYTTNALEVKNSKGEIVFQLILFGARAQFQAKMYSSSGQAVFLIQDPEGSKGSFIVKNWTREPRYWAIQPLFRYPSDLHFGVMASHTNDMRGFLFRGRNYATKGDFTNALSEFSEAARLDPDNIYARMNLGSLYAAMRQFDKAIIEFRAASRLDPSAAGVHFHLGGCHYELEQFGEAVIELRKSIQLDPADASPHVYLAEIFLRQGDFDQALSELEKVIALNASDAFSRYQRAICYLKRDEFDKALLDIEESIRLDPASHSYTVRGHCYRNKGQYTNALSDYNQAICMDSNSFPAYGGIAWIRATSSITSLRNGEEALRMAMKACELSGWENPPCISILAAAYAEVGQFDRAIKYQAQAMNVNGSGVNSWTDKGRIEAQQKLNLYEKGKPYREIPNN